MPTVPAPAIDPLPAHHPRSPVPRANKPISARTLQPRLNVKPQQAFATIPIAPHLRGFVQSGFYEVALTTHAPGPFSHATSQNPQDSNARMDRGNRHSGRDWPDLVGRRDVQLGPRGRLGNEFGLDIASC